MGFAEALGHAAKLTDAVLERALAELGRDGRCPERLVEATRYALLGGGKRFRPFLVIECARLCGGSLRVAAEVGAAFECLHAYSLVHDDLPAMDDDDLRRGRPTVHKAYDEATAILVGDGLQALAFALLSGPDVPPERVGPLVAILAGAAGFAGMVGGQYRDLNAAAMTADDIKAMQAMKTGALIRGACVAGALVAGADEVRRARLSRYGALLGEAFQLADDLLDVEGTAEETGKRVGKDESGGKATLAALLGPQEARSTLSRIVAQAAAELEPEGAAADALHQASRFVADRRS